MSIFENLLSALNPQDNDFTPPNSLCPGNCEIGPSACPVCQPYKERLKDALYNVDHLEEFQARYEVVGQTASGTTTCPHCGAPSSDAYQCDYCGMQIQEGNGKIQVASANDIPDPIIQARDIIYERHAAVEQQASGQEQNGVLSQIFSLITGEDGDDLGSRMSREEIIKTASEYGVSVSSYLNGLDNGVYLTCSAKKAEQNAAAQTVPAQAAAAPAFFQDSQHRPHGGGNRPPRPDSLDGPRRPDGPGRTGDHRPPRGGGMGRR